MWLDSKVNALEALTMKGTLLFIILGSPLTRVLAGQEGLNCGPGMDPASILQKSVEKLIENILNQ